MKGPCVKIANMEIHHQSHEVVKGGRTYRITPKEMGVLMLLAEHRNQVVTRAQLLTTVWEDEFGNDLGLTQAVSRIRKILAGSSICIETIPTKGYRLLCGKSSWSKREIITVAAISIFLISMLTGIFVFKKPVEFKINIRKASSQSVGNQ